MNVHLFLLPSLGGRRTFTVSILPLSFIISNFILDIQKQSTYSNYYQQAVRRSWQGLKADLLSDKVKDAGVKVVVYSMNDNYQVFSKIHKNFKKYVS